MLLTFHLIQADGFTDEDPEISDVVSELRKLFNFRGYRLLSTSVLNVGLVRSNRDRNSVVASGDGLQRIVPADSETPLTIKAEISSRRSTGSVRAKVILTDVTQQVVFGECQHQASSFRCSKPRSRSATVRGWYWDLPAATAEEPVLILIVTPRVDPK